MSNAGGVAAQIILVAQVFLIGLATLEIENGVLARFRERLDRLRQDALDLDISDFDAVRVHRLARRADVLGVELEPSRHWFHAFGLWPQLIFSLGSGALLPIVLWQESAHINVPLVGNPLSDHRYTAGYAILTAELLLLVMLFLHIYSAKRSLRRMADAVIVALGDSDDARYVVTPGLAGLDFSSIPQPRITPRYAPTGDVKRAAECAACVSQATRRLYGRRHPRTVSNDLGYAVRLADAGRLREAVNLAESAAERLDTFGANAVERATAIARLATVHRRAGSIDAALDYARESYDELLRLLGRDHPTTLQVFDELISSLDAVGQYGETFRVLNEEARSSHRPLTLRQKGALARALLRLGRYAKGVETYEEVLGESRATLGYEHPETLIALSNLAVGYHYVGDLELAERVGEEVAEIRSRVLGPEHPDTLVSLNNLAVAYRDLGRLDDALHLCEDVAEIRSRVLRRDHPATLISLHNLAISYRGLGRLEAAQRLHEEVVEMQSRVLGLDHPETLQSLNNLAVIYMERERYADAVRILEDVGERQSRILGEEHPETLASLTNLAICYRGLGRPDDAARVASRLQGAS